MFKEMLLTLRTFKELFAARFLILLFVVAEYRTGNRKVLSLNSYCEA